MMKPVYIHSACAISPQHSFDSAHFLQPVEHTDTGKLFVADPDYRQFISPVAIRRMSRLIKMGIAAGMNALQLAGVDKPDAIITGTGLGSMTDMEHFLKDMINLNEEALNPTYFIQSTYNSINGWIALQSKSTGYNQTYVNRGFSLELSLLDAQLLLNEVEEKQVALVGCFDELTDEYFIVKNKVNYWKKEIPDSIDVLKYSDTKGTIAGEGAAFFTLSNEKENAIGALRGIKMLQHPEPSSIAMQVEAFLMEHVLSTDAIDVVVAGINGDARFQPLYDTTFQQLKESTTVVAFKHLSGEYPTASGFALWLATWLFNAQNLPQDIIYKKGADNTIKNILIINHYMLDTVSFILLSKP